MVVHFAKESTEYVVRSPHVEPFVRVLEDVRDTSLADS